MFPFKTGSCEVKERAETARVSFFSQENDLTHAFPKGWRDDDTYFREGFETSPSERRALSVDGGSEENVGT